MVMATMRLPKRYKTAHNAEKIDQGTYNNVFYIDEFKPKAVLRVTKRTLKNDSEKDAFKKEAAKDQTKFNKWCSTSKCTRQCAIYEVLFRSVLFTFFN